MARSRKPASTQSNAERQAAYRQRHLSDVDAQAERLNMVVSILAKAQHMRLARHHSITQRDLLARLLAEAEGKVVDRLNETARKAYYDGAQ